MNYRSYFCMLLLAVASYGSTCAMQAFNQLPTSDSDASSSSAGQQQQLPLYEVLAIDSKKFRSTLKLLSIWLAHFYG